MENGNLPNQTIRIYSRTYTSVEVPTRYIVTIGESWEISRGYMAIVTYMSEAEKLCALATFILRFFYSIQGLLLNSDLSQDWFLVLPKLLHRTINVCLQWMILFLQEWLVQSNKRVIECAYSSDKSPRVSKSIHNTSKEVPIHVHWYVTRRTATLTLRNELAYCSIN